MRKSPWSYLLMLGVFLVALGASGCSAAFFTAGAIRDASQADYDTLNVMQLMSLAQGDPVKVTCSRDKSVKGLYLGMDGRQTDRYAEIYAQWRVSDSAHAAFPPLDDPVVVEHSSPLRLDLRGVFLGLDPGVICVKTGSDTKRVRVRDLKTLCSAAGTTVTGSELQAALDTPHPPLMSTLLIVAGADTQRVPLYEVDEVRKTNPKNAKWTALAGGVVCDFALATMALLGLPVWHPAILFR